MKKLKLLFMCMIVCLGMGIFSANVLATDLIAPNDETNTNIVDEIEPAKINLYGSSTDNVKTYDVVIPAGEKSVIVKINMKYKGALNIEYLVNLKPENMNMILYNDLACTSQVGYSEYIGTSDMAGTAEYKIPSKGEYYLKFEYSYNIGETDANITIKPYGYSGENKTLTNKKVMGTYPSDYSKEVYHKIVISKAGYIKVEAESVGKYGQSLSGVVLCNAKKQKISDSKSYSSYNDYTGYYAVKKGTYYLSVKDSQPYKIKYTYTAVTDKGGASKAKATTIKKGTTVKALAHMGEKTTKYDWFKITLPKKQKLSLSVSSKADDIIKFKIIPANSKYILFGDSFYLSDSESTTITSKDALNKGTYYIRVNKGDIKGSGYYQIKFK